MQHCSPSLVDAVKDKFNKHDQTNIQSISFAYNKIIILKLVFKLLNCGYNDKYVLNKQMRIPTVCYRYHVTNPWHFTNARKICFFF